MPDDVRISCVSRTDREDPRSRIRYVGGVERGIRWKLSEDSAIAGIDAGRWNFFVRRHGKAARVVVARRHGRRCLEAAGDGFRELPECP